MGCGVVSPTPQLARFPLPARWIFLGAFVPPSRVLQNDVYYEDDLCVVIYDRYPKAKYHLLLIAKVKRSPAPSWCRTSFTWQLVTLTGNFSCSML